MTTQIALRQKTMSITLIIAGAMAFVALLTVSGFTGHILGLFGITYAEALALVQAVVTHVISTLPAWLQVIANRVSQQIVNLYNHLGLQAAVTW